MVATIRERLPLKEKTKLQNSVSDRCRLNKLLDDKTKEKYQIDVANRRSASESIGIYSVGNMS